MKKILLLILVFPISIFNLAAQNAVMSSGGDALGTGGSASYSVGQVVYKQISGTNGYIIQGVQQAYEISVLSSLPEVIYDKHSISIFPVPAYGYVNLRFTSNDFQGMGYMLIDMTGKKLADEKIESSLTPISLDGLAKGVYFLRIEKDNELIRVYKIIKG